MQARDAQRERDAAVAAARADADAAAAALLAAEQRCSDLAGVVADKEQVVVHLTAQAAALSAALDAEADAARAQCQAVVCAA